MDFPLIVVGGGGHAKVVIDTLTVQRRDILGFVDPCETPSMILGIARLGSEEKILRFKPEIIRLVNGVDSTGSMERRKQVFLKFKNKGYVFERVVHPSVIFGFGVTFSEGVQIMAGAVIQAGCHIGGNSIVNMRASLDHDCHLASHVHIAPGAILGGGVRVEEGVHVGAGAVILQGIRVAKSSVVGAGAVVIRDVAKGATVGVPAKSRRSAG